jgi:hypothetical protein
VQRFAHPRTIVCDICAEESSCNDRLGQRHHFDVNIYRVAVLPVSQALFGERFHNVAIGGHAFTMKSGLNESALSEPELALRKQKAVTQQWHQQAQDDAFAEIAMLGDENLLNDVGVKDIDHATVAEAVGNDISVFARTEQVEPQLIPPEIRQIA